MKVPGNIPKHKGFDLQNSKLICSQFQGIIKKKFVITIICYRYFVINLLANSL